MSGLSALNLPQPLVWILAFANIFGLLAAFAHLLKRIAGGRAAELEGGRNRVPRLGLVDSFDLDRHRKLIIVRRDNVEHLLLVGPSDVVVESNIVRAAGAASMREERAAMPREDRGSAMGGPTVTTPVTMPIPPAPATPQTMQGAPAATPPQGPAQAPAPAPAMPAAPFPVPPPVRPAEQRKSAMPPPPPFGAPKRAGPPHQNRVEPVLTAIPGGAAQDKAPVPEAAKPVAAAEATPTVAPRQEPVAAVPVREPAPSAAEQAPRTPAAAHVQTVILPEPTPVEAQTAAPKPAEQRPAEPKAAPIPTPQPAPEAKSAPEAKPEPVAKLEPVAKSEPVARPAEADPILADLSTKLEEVLRTQIRPQDAITTPQTRVPLPILPPMAAADAPAAPVVPPVQAEIVREPEPVPVAAAPPPSSADAFEEELRRILGRSPQKGS